MQRTITRKEIMEYYSDELILEQLLRHSKDREIAGAMPDGRYDSRPNILQYKNDIIRMVEKGVTSFHFSVERWSNPMALSTEAENYDKLRTGWDMVIDIDSKLGIAESKTAALLILDLLKKYGVSNCTIKFSGRRGFHIILPWEMFPRELDFMPLARRYPEIPRVLAGFIRKEIKDELLKQLKKKHNVLENPFQVVEVEKDWGNRHMFRAPYSFNEKTWLISIPVDDIKKFSLKDAEPMQVLRKKEKKEIFYAENGEAEDLLLAAMDWYASIKKEKPKFKKQKRLEKKIAEDKFPPCIKLILSGLKDGRKRSIFTLINFLKMMNWTDEEIIDRVNKWNGQNEKPLPQSIVTGQLRYHLRRSQVPSANCDIGMYYTDIGICHPDKICKGRTNSITIKNPINYPYRKMKVEKTTERKKWRGYTCMCGATFKTRRGLALHKGKVH